MGTRIEQATKSQAFDQRAHALGMAGEMVDGIDVEQVYKVAKRLIDGARQGKPALLTVSCYRFFGHARMDKSPYRSAEDESTGRSRDPVAFSRDRLIASGEITESSAQAIEKAISAEMDESIDFALAGNEPPLASMFRDVYAPGEPEPESVATRLDRVFARV